MAKADEPLTQRDIGRWAFLAMFAGGLAVISGVLALVLPPNLTAVLHAERGGSVNNAQLLAQLEQMRSDQDRIIRENEQLRTRVAELEKQRGQVAERVGALETAIPMLLEAVPPDAQIDRSLVTSAIGVDDSSQKYDAEGGSVSIVRRPLFAIDPNANQDMPSSLSDIAMPQELEPVPVTTLPQIAVAVPQANIVTATDFGIALGDSLGPIDSVAELDAEIAWQTVLNKAGLLMIGLEPALSDPDGTGRARIVAGPITDYASAEDICARVNILGIPCAPVRYRFDPDSVLASE
ncbi:MAG: hypothetical protein H6873_07395 [Hyphomicrobiaceae bacterium]|nr:hypothetical protein [Hyphomicrobiaceae bacterium]